MKTKFYHFSFLLMAIVKIGFPQNTQEVSENVHTDPTHNFTVHRLLILNENNELLMVKEDYVWATPSIIYDKREYVKESLNKLAETYGLKITEPQLRGYFSYKYDYHPHATLRAYFVAKYKSGGLKLPSGMNEAKWVPMEEAIEMNTVTAIKEITGQLLNYPDSLWGGSFLVSRNEKGHPTAQVESFYPLFE